MSGKSTPEKILETPEDVALFTINELGLGLPNKKATLEYLMENEKKILAMLGNIDPETLCKISGKELLAKMAYQVIQKDLRKLLEEESKERQRL